MPQHEFGTKDIVHPYTCECHWNKFNYLSLVLYIFILCMIFLDARDSLYRLPCLSRQHSMSELVVVVIVNALKADNKRCSIFTRAYTLNGINWTHNTTANEVKWKKANKTKCFRTQNCLAGQIQYAMWITRARTDSQAHARTLNEMQWNLCL